MDMLSGKALRAQPHILLLPFLLLRPLLLLLLPPLLLLPTLLRQQLLLLLVPLLLLLLLLLLRPLLLLPPVAAAATAAATADAAAAASAAAATATTVAASAGTADYVSAYATGTVHKDRQTRRQASLFAEVSANAGGHKEACGPRCHRRLHGVRQEAPPGRSRGPVAATEVTAASTMNARATVVPTSHAKVLATAVANEQQQRQS